MFYEVRTNQWGTIYFKTNNCETLVVKFVSNSINMYPPEYSQIRFEGVLAASFQRFAGNLPDPCEFFQLWWQIFNTDCFSLTILKMFFTKINIQYYIYTYKLEYRIKKLHKYKTFLRLLFSGKFARFESILWITTISNQCFYIFKYTCTPKSIYNFLLNFGHFELV